MPTICIIHNVEEKNLKSSELSISLLVLTVNWYLAFPLWAEKSGIIEYQMQVASAPTAWDQTFYFVKSEVQIYFDMHCLNEFLNN